MKQLKAFWNNFNEEKPKPKKEAKIIQVLIKYLKFKKTARTSVDNSTFLH